MAPIKGFLTNHMHTNSLRIVGHCYNSLKFILLLHFHYAQSWHYLNDPKSKFVKFNLKLRLQKREETNFCVLNVKKTYN